MRYSFILALSIGIVSYLYSQKTYLIPFDSFNMVYISEDNAPIYTQPSKRAQIILRRNTLDSVNLITRTNVVNEHGNLEEWYFIDSNFSSNQEMEKKEKGWKVKTVKGWILGRYLVGKNHFKFVKKIQEMFIIARYADWWVYYHIYPNGTFVSKDLNDKNDKGYKGKVYKYRKIISLDFKEFFYYDEEGNLRGQFADVEVITEKKKFPF